MTCATAKIEGTSPLNGETGQDAPLLDELKLLGEDARTYAEAELAFQKARALEVAHGVKRIAILALAAVFILIFALGALVVGLLMGLVSLVGAWGATGIVAGGLVLAAAACVLFVKAQVRRITRLFPARNIDG